MGNYLIASNCEGYRQGANRLIRGALQITLPPLLHMTSEAAEVLWASPVRGLSRSVVPGVVW